ncbi:MAG: META domain-containing protein [Chloroflexi bacterium]|nr:META domain-containing protein [Chloroflexota bacterium]MCI0648931.1 META domain-containing protein [Chloroflexota bacterium]MCI0730862.1 META domain-containing protein [Chloroflexota bacterium]
MDGRKKLAYVVVVLLALALAACTPQAGPGADTGGQTPAGETPAGETPAAEESPPFSAETGGEGDLANTQWSLVSMGAPGAEAPVVAGSTITLAFEAAGQATGSGGCNSYGGEYRVEGNTLSFSNVASTLMACLDEAVMAQEAQYFQALETAGEFELAGDTLAIWYDGGQGVLNFARASAPPGPAYPGPGTPGVIEITPGPAEATPGAAGSEPESYSDDRSGPVELLRSYFNAINRREYTRAYSYWENLDQVGDFEQFQQGYAETQSVRLAAGAIGSDAGAGQVYYAVPVVLEAQTTNGATQRFAGCYILHLSQPGIQGAPPFQPLGIVSAVVEEASGEASAEALLAEGCQGQNTSPITTAPSADPLDISADNYIDNRSGPAELLRSYFNAVNRHEYVRAYTYWEEGAEVPPFAEFEQGYANTESVELEVGQITDGVAAGNTYYDVPVLLRAQTTDGAVQLFVGCYRLHLGSPAAQAQPPFRPLGIMAATVQEAASEAEATALLGSAEC